VWRRLSIYIYIYNYIYITNLQSPPTHSDRATRRVYLMALQIACGHRHVCMGLATQTYGSITVCRIYLSSRDIVYLFFIFIDASYMHTWRRTKAICTVVA